MNMSNYPPGVYGSEFEIAGPDTEETTERFCGRCDCLREGTEYTYREEVWWICDYCKEQYDGYTEGERPDEIPSLTKDSMAQYQDFVGDLMLNEAKDIKYLGLGLTGEAGEVANIIKKVVRNSAGVPSNDDKKKLADELGDVLWYVAALSEQLSLRLEDIAFSNIEKLYHRRYFEPNGLKHE